ncbi:MAG: hypothetical protein WA666_03180 [Nitrospirota bacterium]
MDIVQEIQRAFHEFMDGRITKAELQEKLRELKEGEKAQASLPFTGKETA